MSERLLLEQVKVGDKDARRRCWIREYLTFVPSFLSGSLPPAGQDRGGLLQQPVSVSPSSDARQWAPFSAF